MVSRMRPTDKQLELFHQRCDEMRGIGAGITSFIKNDIFGSSAVVTILFKCKFYHFSDPDWDVIIKQLSSLVNYHAIKQHKSDYHK